MKKFNLLSINRVVFGIFLGTSLLCSTTLVSAASSQPPAGQNSQALTKLLSGLAYQWNYEKSEPVANLDILQKDYTAYNASNQNSQLIPFVGGIENSANQLNYVNGQRNAYLTSLVKVAKAPSDKCDDKNLSAAEKKTCQASAKKEAAESSQAGDQLKKNMADTLGPDTIFINKDSSAFSDALQAGTNSVSLILSMSAATSSGCWLGTTGKSTLGVIPFCSTSASLTRQFNPAEFNYSYYFKPEVSLADNLTSTFLTYLSDNINNPYALINWSGIKPVSGKQHQFYKTLQRFTGTQNMDYINFKNQARTMLAQKSVAISALNGLLKERRSYQNAPSRLQELKQIATHRMSSKTWAKQLQSESPAAVNRTVALELAEMENLQYQQYINQERLTSILSVMLVQNTDSTNKISLKTLSSKVNASIKKCFSSKGCGNGEAIQAGTPKLPAGVSIPGSK